ncbi:MAG: hypothetical protein ACREQ5_36115, partial [Candidatus Dormibacteria bacterium]
MTGHVIAFPQKRAIGRLPTEAGLSDEEFQAICRLGRQLPAGWLIERIEDPLDGLTAMLLKVDGDEPVYDEGFIVSREGEYLHLERLEGDDISPLGIFCSVPMVLRFLRNGLQNPALRAFHSTGEADADTDQAQRPSFLIWCAPNNPPEDTVKLATDRLAA